MITVNLKPGQIRSNQGGAGKAIYFVSSIVNWHPAPLSNIWRPATDVYETEDKLVVRVEIPGMQSDEVSVNFNQGLLTIQGTRSEVAEKRAFHQMEIHFGEFMTEVDIPIPIDLANIEAAYLDGFLKVVLPKAVPKHIKINQE